MLGWGLTSRPHNSWGGGQARRLWDCHLKVVAAFLDSCTPTHRAQGAGITFPADSQVKALVPRICHPPVEQQGPGLLASAGLLPQLVRWAARAGPLGGARARPSPFPEVLNLACVHLGVKCVGYTNLVPWPP